jgi:hypothetical protein
MRRRLGAEEAMQNPEICRSQAVKCMLLAREANDFPYKLMLLSIAQLWRGIAETSESPVKNLTLGRSELSGEPEGD